MRSFMFIDGEVSETMGGDSSGNHSTLIFFQTRFIDFVEIDECKFQEFIGDGSAMEFDDWTSLVSEIEKTCPDDIEKICRVYDPFLLNFPLCYGYWRKYAKHVMRLSTVDKVLEIFERAVESATYSVDVWVDYCTFGCLVFEDPADVRRLFERGLSFVGKDYLCHTLWDKYIEFEFSHQHWKLLADLYVRTLMFPSKKLQHYYGSFKRLVTIWKEEMESSREATLSFETESIVNGEVPTCRKRDEITTIIRDFLDPSIGLDRLKSLQKYISIGEKLYENASLLNEKINGFETCIKRSYFHVKPLDDHQLENWHQYLDFAESHGDFDWAVKLYERCLIPSANYPEFWMRYVDFVESKGGRELANFVLDRAAKTFLKRVSAIHLFNARFKEHIGEVLNAHAAFLQCDTQSDYDFMENVVMKANMERRLGNLTEASNIYKEVLKTAAAHNKSHLLPVLYVHFSRLEHTITDVEDRAINVLIDGTKHVPESRLLIEELIKFAMTHNGRKHISLVDSIVSRAISSTSSVSCGLTAQDREFLSRLYLEFIDLCGSINDVRKAWKQHIRLFPHSLRPSICTQMGRNQWEMSREAQQDSVVPSLSEDKKRLSPKANDVKPATSHNATLLPDMQSDQAMVDQHQSRRAEKTKEKASEEGNHTPSVMKEKDVDQPFDQDSDRDSKPPSLERLSLGSQIGNSPDTAQSPRSHHSTTQRNSFVPPSSLEYEAHDGISLQEKDMMNCEVSQEHNIQNGSTGETGQSDANRSSPFRNSTSVSALTNAGGACPSSNHDITAGLLPADNWQYNHNRDRFHLDSKYGFHGRSDRRLQQKRHQSQRYQKFHQSSTQGYPSQSLPPQTSQVAQHNQVQFQQPAPAEQTTVTAPQTWSMQNPEQSTHAPTYSEQQGNMQDNQLYSQMWQYYYPQQALWQQQQQYQHHYTQQQQPLQQQYQQQLLQMQYFQQQQLPQLQQQQQDQQQQEQYQQYLLYMQQQQPSHEQLQQYYNLQQRTVELRPEQEKEQTELVNASGIEATPTRSTDVLTVVGHSSSPDPEHRSPVSDAT